MRRGRVITAIAMAVTMALVGGPAAYAASPRAVYEDYADNGRLDNGGTMRDLQAALQNPTVQGYGNPVASVTGRAGVEQAALAEAGARGQLPFTGTELTLLAAAGLGLLGTGILFRLAARERARQ